MKKTDSFKQRFMVATIALLCLVIVFSVVFVVYVQRFDVTLAEENRIRLAEVSEHVASHLRQLLEWQIESLKVVAYSADAIDSDTARIDYLDQMAEMLGFEYIGIVGPDGMLHAKSLPYVQDVSLKPYYLSALAGELTVSDLVQQILTNSAVSGAIVSVPIENGVIMALVDVSKLGSEIQLDSFSGKGRSYVVDKNGGLVLHARSIQYRNYFQSLRNMEFAEGYDVESMLDDIRSQREGMSVYTELGTEKFAYYRPLGFNDWTVVSIVPTNELTVRTARLTQELAVVCMVAILVFLVLITTIFTQFVQLESKRKANQAKSAFLSNMSHDMRTPLNAIVGLSTIADKHTDDPALVHDSLKKVTFASRQLLGLINDILDMSRIESQRMVLSSEVLSLPDIVEGVVDIINYSIQNRHQILSVRLHDVLHESLYGDNLRLSQVFTNILNNATKFTPEGGHISLDISEIPSADDGYASYRFTFSDDGIGMSADFMKNLFVPFSRELDARIDKIEGSGLGMSIAKKIIDLMGGTIEVMSEVGKGTTFIVSLSFPVNPECPLVQPVPAFADVLVVDLDEPQGRETLKAFEHIGVRADLALGCDAMIGFIADHLANKTPYQAVFLDRAIYDNGCLKSLPGRCLQLPPLILCAYDWKDIHSQAQQDGILLFIQKPLFQSTLRKALLSLPEHGRPAEESPAPMTPDFTGSRILIAEDNEFNLEIAETILDETGATIVSTRDGAECVGEYLRSDEGWYDLILMDVQMPKMNGYEATRRIRESRRTDADIPVVAMSANAFAEDMAEAKAVGMDGYLTKPIDIDVWFVELHKYLSLEK